MIKRTMTDSTSSMTPLDNIFGDTGEEKYYRETKYGFDNSLVIE
jgi:hypothetical protein